MSSKKMPFPKNFAAISLLYGVISAVLMALLTLAFYYVSGSGSTPVIIWNYLILAFAMFFGIKAYQKKINKDIITFKEAYVSGVFIGITTAVIFAVFMIFYTKYIDIEFIKNFISINSLKINKDITADELKQQIQLITPAIIGFYAFGQLILISLFLPLLIFIFFKHRKTVNSK